MARGLNYAFWMFALGLTLSFLGGVGYFGAVGMHVGGGGAIHNMQQVNKSVGGQQSGQAPGGNSGSYLGFTSAAINTISVLWVLVTNAHVILETVFPIPSALAWSIQLLFQLGMGLLIVQLVRGVMFE